MTTSRLAFICLTAATLALATVPASAQGPRSGPGSNWGPGWGPGMMMGPGPMWGPSTSGRGQFGHMCDPRMAGFAAYQVDQMERTLKLTDAQRKPFDDLKTASAKAAEIMTAACPSATPATAPARLEFMEKRAGAMLASIKTVRPAYEAFYAALTDEQKKSLDRIGPREQWWHRFWRGS